MALEAQGLGAAVAPFGIEKEGALRAIEHLGYVQVDTISVIQRAHHHVLWSRVPGYGPEHLHTLQAEDREVFEYWSHAASFLPMRDFRFSRPLMRSFANGQTHWGEPAPEMDRAMRSILTRLRRNGPFQARDVIAEQTVNGGWGSFTKIERRALHELWMQERVMIRSRAGFEKVYDLPERVMPEGVERRLPSAREVAIFRVRQAVRAHGLVREREISHLATAASRREIRAALDFLLRRGEVVEVRVETHPEQPCFGTPEALNAMYSPLPPRVRFLSPFDNLIIQRARLRWLFGFDYQLECYVPALKRRCGYFVLPILVGDTFAGRLDATAERSAGVLRIKTLLLEPSSLDSIFSRAMLDEALHDFAAFNNCTEVRLEPQATKAATALDRS